MFILKLLVASILPRHFGLKGLEINPLDYTSPNSKLSRRYGVAVVATVSDAKEPGLSDNFPDQVLVRGVGEQAGWKPLNELRDLILASKVEARRVDMKSADDNVPFVLFDFWSIEKPEEKPASRGNS